MSKKNERLVDQMISFILNGKSEEEITESFEIDPEIYETIKFPKIDDPKAFFQRLRRGYDLVDK